MILAQHGFGKTDKLSRALAADVVRGVVLGPRDESPENMEALAQGIRGDFPGAEVLFDPQLYASVVSPASDGHLPEYESFYQPGLTRRSFLSAAKVADCVQSALRYQLSLGVTKLIGPTVCVEDFDDPWSQIALSLAQASVEHHARLGEAPPLLVSLAFAESALDSHESVEELLDLVTAFETSGFYVIVKRTLANYSAWFDPNRLQNLLYLVYALADRNGFDVYCGYTDLYGFLLRAAGARAIATGWTSGLRQFSLARFQPRTGGRQPRPRYTSAPLLSSILKSELDAIAALGALDPVLSGTPEDRGFARAQAAGSVDWPPDVSVLHHWRVLGGLTQQLPRGPVGDRLDACLRAVSAAKEAYQRLRALGMPFEPGADAHLEQWREGIEGFRAWIDA